jgi:hypothetical protein
MLLCECYLAELSMKPAAPHDLVFARMTNEINGRGQEFELFSGIALSTHEIPKTTELVAVRRTHSATMDWRRMSLKAMPVASP